MIRTRIKHFQNQEGVIEAEEVEEEEVEYSQGDPSIEMK